MQEQQVTFPAAGIPLAHDALVNILQQIFFGTSGLHHLVTFIPVTTINVC